MTGAVSAHMMEKEEDVQPKNQNYSKVSQPTDLEGTGKKEKVKMTEDEMEKHHVFPISTATIVFQGLMILASIYYSMLMTNWGKPSVEDSTFDGFFNNGPMSYWVQLSALWISQAIYIFSLTAPICFPNRDFGGGAV